MSEPNERTVKLVGGYGSPYSRKMRAVLRYRRIPFRWILRGSAEDVGIPDVPVALVPVLVLSDGTASIDSTPQIRRLEEIYPERSVIHPDPALRFIDALIEDYADEWLTKPMFHYRWWYEPDIEKAAHILPLDRRLDLSADRLEQGSRMIAERQIGRLGVVGSNETTRPVIEDSYRRLLGLLDALLLEAPFTMGGRPGASDFGLFGQLTQLAQFDPTPAAIAAKEAPRVVSWVNRVDDLGSLEVDNDAWLAPEAADARLRPLLEEIGRVYVPFLLANASALEAAAAQVEAEIDGRKWVQQPFPYQGKCLNWLREGYAALPAEARGSVDALLSGTGCEALF